MAKSKNVAAGDRWLAHTVACEGTIAEIGVTEQRTGEVDTRQLHVGGGECGICRRGRSFTLMAPHTSRPYHSHHGRLNALTAWWHESPAGNVYY